MSYKKVNNKGQTDSPAGEFIYGYSPNSTNLTATVTSPVHITINTWEPNRDVLKAKDNQVDNQSVSKYTYGINALGQRSGVNHIGSAFAQIQQIDWAYNIIGEVVGAVHSTDDAQDRVYSFDGIGNRLASTEGAITTSYTPNAANQYSSIGTVAPIYDLDGNLTNDGSGATLIWDGENRLVQFQKGTNHRQNGVSQKFLRFWLFRVKCADATFS